MEWWYFWCTLQLLDWYAESSLAWIDCKIPPRKRWHWSVTCLKKELMVGIQQKTKKQCSGGAIWRRQNAVFITDSQITCLPKKYTKCMLTIALNKHNQNTWIIQEEHTLTLPPQSECPHSWGSFTHVIQLFSYLFVNLVSLQISLGDKIMLSAGNQTSGYNGFGIHQHSCQ